MQSPGELKAKISVGSGIIRTARVAQLEGIFDVPAAEKSSLSWDVCLPLGEKPWNVGLIVGPSGCGKSTVARHLFNDALGAGELKWPQKKSVLDAFPEDMPIKEITELLSSVGFSSPPSWLRPFSVLSTGEQFRVSMARVLAEQKGLVAIDEFTSVIDRTVARIGSHAIARTVRKRKQQLVAVTCHEDVLDWLQPDWVYRPAENAFQWRSLQRHPDIELKICRVHSSAWTLFKNHHYLSSALTPSAVCFCAFWDDRPVVFSAWLPVMSKHPQRREHRTVTLPDFQGVGMGNVVSAYCASVFRGLGMRASSTTTHPSMIRHRMRSPLWKCNRKPGLIRNQAGKAWTEAGRDRAASISRLTASFIYCGPKLDREQALAIYAQQP